MSLRDRIAQANCVGCRAGVHDPTKLYPCLTTEEWLKREAAQKRRFPARDMTGLLHR